MEEKSNILICENCGKEMPSESKCCPYCGQTVKNKKVSFIDLFSDFFSNFFNLDFKILLSFKTLFIPGKLTQDYFSGKHGSYASPWRLFFVSIVLMLIVVGINKKVDNAQDDKRGKEKIEKTKWKYYKSSNDAVSKVDSIIKEVTTKNLKSLNFNSEKELDVKTVPTKKRKSKFRIDSIKNKFSKEDFRNLKMIYNDFDTAFYYSDKEVKKILDSSIYVLNKQFKEVYFDSVKIFDCKVSRFDLKNLSLIQLKNKYKIKKDTTFSNRISSKINYIFNSRKLSFSKVSDFLLKNLNWFIIFLMPFTALIFKLLYIRRKRFFIEHLIFNLHNHAAILFLFSVFVVLSWFSIDILNIITGLVLGFGPGLYFIFSMRRYYKQSWIKTIIKFSLFSIIYFFFMLIFGTIFFMIGAFFVFQ